MTGPFPFAVEYRFSRRRTVSLEVRDARVRVRAPVGTSQRVLQQFVASRASWVSEKLAQQEHRIAQRPSYRFVAGEILPLLDGQLTIAVGPASKNSVTRSGDILLVGLSGRSVHSPQAQTEALVIAWYRQWAHELLTAKTERLCQRLGLHCREVRVRATRSKWGHCTGDGRIQYNWQIVLAPEQVVDYLVAHEVCHLRHPHHGPAFWQQVAEVCPDYQSLRKWLREQGFRLVLSS